MPSDTIAKHVERLLKHIEEWRDSVEVGTEVPIDEVANFKSGAFGNNPPPSTHIALRFTARMEPVPGVIRVRVPGVDPLVNRVSDSYTVRRVS